MGVNFNDIKNELRKIMTPDTVFVCIGTNRCKFDIFGPLCGNLLREKNIPYYGDCDRNVNGVTMNHRLHEIYKIDKIDNKNIIAIDAAVTDDDDRVNKVVINHERGVKPGAGVGRLFPEVGEKAIMMFTLHKRDVNTVMNQYRQSNYIGNKYDLCNYDLIEEYATKLVDVIEEVYNEVNCVVEI